MEEQKAKERETEGLGLAGYISKAICHACRSVQAQFLNARWGGTGQEEATAKQTVLE